MINDNRKVIVGSDETLKGDTFGGLIVAGFRANDEEREQLKNIGVKDSKRISDNVIIRIADDLRKFFPNNFFVIELFPKQYNDLLSVEKLTPLLNRLHKEIYEKLKISDSIHVVDLYPGCIAGDVVETKAESKYVEVAAASILAREVALKQFNELSKKADFLVPKGSTHVLEALKKLNEKNLNFEEFVKISFSNVKRFIK
ncbi:hypothetical protein CMO90_03335 [Candidatus Woesearchaeota archaeon]|jgi:ribonuclease HIII|nr:hypothetical protein [Candidatus Woesearchaeota archaeon]